MVEIHLRAAAYELLREGMAASGRRRGMYKVMMPNSLAANLEAARTFGEDVSDVIMRLVNEAKTPAKPSPRR
jgi:hypothetical protein